MIYKANFVLIQKMLLSYKPLIEGYTMKVLHVQNDQVFTSNEPLKSQDTKMS
jgi:hypothetical protein